MFALNLFILNNSSCIRRPEYLFWDVLLWRFCGILQSINRYSLPYISISIFCWIFNLTILFFNGHTKKRRNFCWNIWTLKRLLKRIFFQDFVSTDVEEDTDDDVDIDDIGNRDQVGKFIFYSVFRIIEIS